jgi:hypothetical protein
MNVYWFQVHYPRGKPHVNVQFAESVSTAYAQEVHASIELPRAMNAKYPRQTQPVALRVNAMRPPTREHLTRLDPGFQRYLDDYLKLSENDSAPVEPSGSDRSPIF